MKVLRDAVHGDVYLPDEWLSIIDTPGFQRLRAVRQLGFAHLVYPCALHTRFEHSIGAAHVALALWDRAQGSFAGDASLARRAILSERGELADTLGADIRTLNQRYRELWTLRVFFDRDHLPTTEEDPAWRRIHEACRAGVSRVQSFPAAGASTPSGLPS